MIPYNSKETIEVIITAGSRDTLEDREKIILESFDTIEEVVLKNSNITISFIKVKQLEGICFGTTKFTSNIGMRIYQPPLESHTRVIEEICKFVLEQDELTEDIKLLIKLRGNNIG